MIRPMASNVSALSSVVAKGHQAIHFVSSAPSIHSVRRVLPSHVRACKRYYGLIRQSDELRPAWLYRLTLAGLCPGRAVRLTFPSLPAVYSRACPSRGLPQPESAITTRPNHPLPRQDLHLRVCQRSKAAHRGWFKQRAVLASLQHARIFSPRVRGSFPLVPRNDSPYSYGLPWQPVAEWGSARGKGADHRVNAHKASCTQKGCQNCCQPVFDLTRVDWSGGANMIRPMASKVSALSSVVAKGHQAIHFASSAPSIHSVRRVFPRLMLGAPHNTGYVAKLVMWREVRASRLGGPLVFFHAT